MTRSTGRTAAVAAGLAAVALAAALAGCSTGGSAEPAAAAADIAFAQSMIPHHEQAVEMADLALDPSAGASAQVRALAEQIRAAQAPEIEQMSGWLSGWGAPTAMPGASSAAGMAGMDHSGHDMGGIDIAGMMGEQQMDDLSAASGEEFDRMWLELMIEHHRGAVAMAEQVAAGTADQAVAAMASAIVAAQQQEIATMQALLR